MLSKPACLLACGFFFVPFGSVECWYFPDLCWYFCWYLIPPPARYQQLWRLERRIVALTDTFVRNLKLAGSDRLYAVVKEKHGHIDILFANAGAGTVAPLAVATEAHFDQTFDVNVKGMFFTVQKALPLFKDGGSIILTSSVSNVLGLPAFTAYAASKAAVRNFARGWTLELKDRKIRVNCMSPGAIDTPALATTTGLTAEQAEQAAAQFITQIPMGRRGMPEEIAAAVAFLASDESSYITGIDLPVDGGMAQG